MTDLKILNNDAADVCERAYYDLVDKVRGNLKETISDEEWELYQTQLQLKIFFTTGFVDGRSHEINESNRQVRIMNKMIRKMKKNSFINGLEVGGAIIIFVNLVAWIIYLYFGGFF